MNQWKDVPYDIKAWTYRFMWSFLLSSPRKNRYETIQIPLCFFQKASDCWVYIRVSFSLMLKDKSPQSLHGYPEVTLFLWLNIHNFTRSLLVQNRNPTPDSRESNQLPILHSLYQMPSATVSDWATLAFADWRNIMICARAPNTAD